MSRRLHEEHLVSTIFNLRRKIGYTLDVWRTYQVLQIDILLDRKVLVTSTSTGGKQHTENEELPYWQLSFDFRHLLFIQAPWRAYSLFEAAGRLIECNHPMRQVC
jgi:hypothetical protein